MKEKLSALMDGELGAQEMDDVLKHLREERALLHDWAAWQAGSNVMKGEFAPDAAFLQRFSQRLEAEPVVLAPQVLGQRPSRWRRLALPLGVAASVVFVSVAMWRYYAPPAEGMLPSQSLAERDNALHDYLAAHRQSEGNPFADREGVRAHIQMAGSR